MLKQDDGVEEGDWSADEAEVVGLAGTSDGGEVERRGGGGPGKGGGTGRDLTEEGLGSLYREAVIYAEWRIGRYRWRGAWEGVLPYGYDAESVASEALQELLRRGAKNGEGRVQTGEELREELRGLIRLRVRRLSRRMENVLFRNEWDILSPGEGGELRSVFDGMEGKIASPDEVLVAREGRAEAQQMKERVEAWLGGDRVAQEVFRCLSEGMVKRREIAAALGVTARAVTDARRRLERKTGAIFDF